MMKCSVDGKVKCIYRSKVIKSESHKRKGQPYKVIASEVLNEDFQKLLKNGLVTPTVKLDGTCCFIDYFNGRPWLWARHDIKPNKTVDKRFKEYQRLKNEHLLSNKNDEKYPDFSWNIETDFKEFPDNWKAASGLPRDQILPDDIGHIVGWVPIDPSLRNHLWHLSVVDLTSGVGLFLSHDQNNDDMLHVSVNRLEDYIGKTFELIGSNVNANPYGVGDKRSPFHVLVQHGEIAVKDIPLFENNENNLEVWKNWFNETHYGKIEGIVWHSEEGKMFKLHRHHLDLPWPGNEVYPSKLAVTFHMNNYDTTGYNKNKLFTTLMKYDGLTLQTFDSIFKEENDVLRP